MDYICIYDSLGFVKSLGSKNNGIGVDHVGGCSKLIKSTLSHEIEIKVSVN